MFRSHVELWLQGKDEHVVKYVKEMLDHGSESVVSWQHEIENITFRMSISEPYGVQHQYLWSVRDWLGECLRWYEYETLADRR